MSRPPRAILFDALGTLVELEPPAPLLRAELAQRFGVEISHAQAAHAIEQEISYYRSHLNEGRDAGALAVLRRRCADVLRAALPQSDRLGAVTPPQLEDVLLSSLRFNAFEDALPALSRLRANGSTLVVVSNWDVSLHDVLARVGLSSQLSAIVTSAEAGSRKPSPAIFERALALAEVVASDALHVGDSEAEDVIGARNAGVEPVLLSRTCAPGPEGVLTIHTLAELLI
ncbi:MAG: HAD-IA family hydrolase [Solirubrobacterales bacterium]|nr:HAD-IA family hydrolase [Solirubrobacterales bacterium]